MQQKHIYEALFVLLVLLTLFTGLSLFSYSSDDPSYSNIVFTRYDEPIANIFGKAGAYSADFLGLLFGWTALLLPLGFIYTLVTLVKVYRQRFSGIKAAGRITEMLLLIAMLSMFTGLVAETDAFFPDKSGGGLLGVLSSVVLASFLGKAGGVILCVFFIMLLLFALVRTPVMKLVAMLNNREKHIREEKEDGASLLARLRDSLLLTFAGLKQRHAEWEIKTRAEKTMRDERQLAEMMKASNKETQPYYMAENAAIQPVQAVEEDEIVEPVASPEEEREEASPIIGAVDLGEPLQIELGEIIPDVIIEKDEELVAPAIISAAATEVFKFPLDGELLTVSKLEQMLAEHERKQADNIAESDIDTQESSVLNVFEELAKDEYVVTAPLSTALQPIMDYTLPFTLLEQAAEDTPQPDMDMLRAKADLLLGKLRDFNVDGTIREICPGPVVTLFELEPAPGVKISKISNLENDLALAMSAISIRIIAPIPGKAAVGIEIPNEHRQTVKLRELLETEDFEQNQSPLAVAFGKDISGKPYFADLRGMPHLLVAGTTGSGKSVCINTIICSILYKSSPQDVKFVMIDPKMVELNVYNGIPHLAAPVVTDPKKAAAVLNNVVKEMEARYKHLSECNVRNIDSYSKYINSHPELGLVPMPYMVVIVDEFGDLMMVAGKEVEAAIIRIAQLARAVGIHLVLATQRPSVNVITGIIKANMPARISFRVSSKIDSRTILDQNGAEFLLGRGDSLFIPPGTSFTTRIHGCFVSEDEVKNIVDELKTYGEPDYNMQLLEEPMAAGVAGDEVLDSRFEEAVQIAKEKGEVSISMIQRYLRIGYNRAARIVESMEQQGLIAASDGTSKPRKFIG